jgi:hypothetical protein
VPVAQRYSRSLVSHAIAEIRSARVRPIRWTSTMRALLLALTSLLAGCFLPMATGAPETARTVGSGNFGASFHAEVPTLNLTAEEDDLAEATADHVAIAPAGALSLGVQYGVSDSVDLELRLDGALYYFLVPIPLGGQLGARITLLDQPGLALALAGRVGFLGFSSSSDDDGDGTADGEADRASATFATIALTFELGSGFARPAFTLSATPANVSVDLAGEAEKDYRAVATTGTVSLHMGRGPLTFTPFLALTYFSSPSIDSQGFVSGGVAFYWGHPAERPQPLPPPRPYPAPAY